MAFGEEQRGDIQRDRIRADYSPKVEWRSTGRDTINRVVRAHWGDLKHNHVWTIRYVYLNSLYYSYPADPPVTYEEAYFALETDRRNRGVHGSKIRSNIVKGKMRELKLERFWHLYSQQASSWGRDLGSVIASMSLQDMMNDDFLPGLYGLPVFKEGLNIEIAMHEWRALKDNDNNDFFPIELPGQIESMLLSHIPAEVSKNAVNIDSYLES